MRRIFLAGAALAAVSFASPASADTVSDWWETAHRYWLAGQGAPGPRSPDAERAATRATLAMFEAVNAIDRRYQSYLGFPAADRTASQDAAAATAAYKVLLKHYPANKAALDESYTLGMAELGDGPAIKAGQAIGETSGRGGDERQRDRSGGGSDIPIGRARSRASGWRPHCRRWSPIGRP